MKEELKPLFNEIKRLTLIEKQLIDKREYELIKAKINLKKYLDKNKDKITKFYPKINEIYKLSESLNSYREYGYELKTPDSILISFYENAAPYMFYEDDKKFNKHIKEWKDEINYRKKYEPSHYLNMWFGVQYVKIIELPYYRRLKVKVMGLDKDFKPIITHGKELQGDISIEHLDRLIEVRKEKQITKEDIGILYIINVDSTNLYKIGITSNIESRLSTLKTSSPFSLNLYSSYTILKRHEVEKRIHKKYQQNRKNGEWFHLEYNQLIEITKELSEIEKIDSIILN